MISKKYLLTDVYEPKDKFFLRAPNIEDSVYSNKI